MKISQGKSLFALGFVLIVVDQIIKILVKTNMALGEHIHVFGNWFQLLFVENEGMAFGWSFGEGIGKILLTSFRIILSIFLIWWISSLCRKNSEAREWTYATVKVKAPVPTGFLIGITMITAGAIGNIIDCLLYGQIFTESLPGGMAASLGGSYAPVMLGRVVDMFYFPIINTTWPAWLPLIGGKAFTFFDPVFNFADSCVTCGAIYLLLFQWKFISELSDDKQGR